MDERGIEIMSKFDTESEFYQFIHKFDVKNGQIKRRFFRRHLNFHKELSADLDSMTEPEKNPNYTLNHTNNPEENGVIAHTYKKIKEYPLFEAIEYAPVEGNPAHHNIKFNVQNEKDSNLIADYICDNSCYSWKIPI